MWYYEGQEIQIDNERIVFKDTKAYYTGKGIWFCGKKTPDGEGVAKFENGDKFEGKFSYGEPKNGIYVFKNGSYCGVKYCAFNTIKYTTPYGYPEPTKKIEVKYKNSTYVGEVENGEANGIGKMTYVKDGLLFKKETHYIGGFKDGDKHGVGKYIFSNGEDYDICVYEEGKEIYCFEKGKIEKESSYISDEDSDPYDYEQDRKEMNKKLFLEYYHEGRYDLAYDILYKFELGEEIESYKRGCLTVSEWKDLLNEQMDENNY